MGRKRKDGDPLGLAGTRLALRRGKFYYRHRDGGEEFVSEDLSQAKKRAARYNDPGSNYGTVSYWFTLYLADCERRVKAGLLAPRTLSDYRSYVDPDKKGNERPLTIFFGTMLPEDIRPTHVQQYVDAGAQAGRPFPANRDRACLSSMLSWLLRQPECPPALVVNCCMQASGVVRNEEPQRERYVTHDEYQEVWAVATKPERLMMALTYRTLQRPESDIVLWTTAVIVSTSGGRALEFIQNKTKRRMRVAFSDEMDLLLPAPTTNVRTLKPLVEPIVRDRNGDAYTYDRLSKMLRESIATANARRVARGVERMQSFGYRDLKGKGATDMWLQGIPLEQIQQLCGHANKSTTERYVKARYRETAQPNRVKLGT